MPWRSSTGSGARSATATSRLELTAETFACALAGLARFRGAHRGSGVAWLYGIANNQVRPYRRRNRVESEGRRKIGMSVRSYDLPMDEESI